jgi:hypothetical protein
VRSGTAHLSELRPVSVSRSRDFNDLTPASCALVQVIIITEFEALMPCLDDFQKSCTAEKMKCKDQRMCGSSRRSAIHSRDSLAAYAI